jgi:LmbE family N-acetylglucosaminyl deacetylase
MVFLDYSSESINKGKNIDLIESLVDLVQKTSPDIIYTHNPADKHDTHVSVTLHTINALRLIEKEKLPKKIYGCELWRNLDWMLDQDKIIADVSRQENLQLALIGVFDSQISGGKRYDLATIGRRKANATFYQMRSHDDATSLVYEMDLTPLIKNSEIQIEQYIDKYIERFRHDVLERIRRLS